MPVDCKVNIRIYDEFLESNQTLRVYKNDRLIFSSQKERLLPLLEYIDTCAPCEHDVVVFDRVVGNAAALLFKLIFCKEVSSPLASEIAVETLDNNGIRHHFMRTVPHIENQERDDLCPMEKLSIGKEPEEFYQALIALRKQKSNPDGDKNDR